jgi:hypothetical protein
MPSRPWLLPFFEALTPETLLLHLERGPVRTTPAKSVAADSWLPARSKIFIKVKSELPRWPLNRDRPTLRSKNCDEVSNAEHRAAMTNAAAVPFPIAVKTSSSIAVRKAAVRRKASKVSNILRGVGAV